MAEAIIHEFSHCLLNKYAENTPLINVDHIGLYSPWREDARPLYGLFHAVFVFTQINLFYDSLQSYSNSYILLNSKNAVCHSAYLHKSIFRTKIGLNQIDIAWLSPDGASILSSLQVENDKLFMKYGLVSKPVPQDLIDHMLSWQVYVPNSALSILK